MSLAAYASETKYLLLSELQQGDCLHLLWYIITLNN